MKIDFSAVRARLNDFEFGPLFREELGWDNHQAELNVTIDDADFHLKAIAHKRGFVAYLWQSSTGVSRKRNTGVSQKSSTGVSRKSSTGVSRKSSTGVSPVFPKDTAGMAVLPSDANTIPDRPTRLKIDHKVAGHAREHLIIYADPPAGRQIWQWVRREPGKPMACREHRFDARQSNDALIQRLDQIAVGLDEEEDLTVVDVAGRARAAFDVDKVTKKFYDRFKTEHAAFLKLIRGIQDDEDLQWYASLMLNRLMFVYFIQKKGFLDGDPNYLRNRLQAVQQVRGDNEFQSFYRYFLIRLFHDGLGKTPGNRALNRALEKLLGKVPYLNGGFFEPHQIERKNPDIDIPDKAFEKLFDFFDQYSWHLDERPLRADNEINPDVLGYIFEKYINQKQMGAYYTKEDITEYIARNTIVPFLLETARDKCRVAFENPEGPSLWELLRENPDRYIFPAVRHGVSWDYRPDHPDQGVPIDQPREIPPDIAAGIDPPTLHEPVGDVESVNDIETIRLRKDWNRAAPPEIGLPTETWREAIARRKRCEDIRNRLAAGEIRDVNDLITLNLDIRQFAQDAIEACEGPDILRAFWHAIRNVTVLDPTCGSGAFLFAALNILEPLYEACLDRMHQFVDEVESTEAQSSTAQSSTAQSSTGVSPVSPRENNAPSPPTNTGETPVLRSSAEFVPFGPDDLLDTTERNLPHWQQSSRTYFITFRLADSLPAGRLAQWQHEREVWLKAHPRPWSPQTQQDYAVQFPERLNRWLDAGHGECLLARPEVAEIVENALYHFDGERYLLDAWVIMPNHVHLLLKPLGQHALPSILHSWKSFTAHAINRKLERQGSLWQDESYDHIVRSGHQLEFYRIYINENPAKANVPANSARTGKGKGIEIPDEESLTSQSSTAESSTGESSTGESSTGVSPVKKSTAAQSSTGVSPVSPRENNAPSPPTNTGETPVLPSSRSARRKRPAYHDFRDTLDHVAAHPNRRYYIFKSIVLNNLFGVDIMEEAVEICKLRLFLKLAAQVEPDPARANYGVEPLPDIDFNIRAGNTLVGYATEDQAREALEGDIADAYQWPVIQDAAERARTFAAEFRRAQGDPEATPEDQRGWKKALSEELHGLRDQLDRALARDYGIDLSRKDGRAEYPRWLQSHQPFHWFAEFFDIMQRGGFDVVIGNPPWAEYSTVRNQYTVRAYETVRCGNLHVLCTERSLLLRANHGFFSFIVQLPLTSSSRMNTARSVLRRTSQYLHILPFDDRPGKLFEGLSNCRSVILVSSKGIQKTSTTEFLSAYRRWPTGTRSALFQTQAFVKQDQKLLIEAPFPKIQSDVQRDLLGRMGLCSDLRTADFASSPQSAHFVFYQEATRYWAKAAIGLPYYAKNGIVGVPAHGRYLYFEDTATCAAAMALLNSSLFYAYFIAYGDCFHLSATLATEFPIAEGLMEDSSLSDLGKHLDQDLRAKADQKQINTKSGDRIDYAEFAAWRSKPIIDEIDAVLARHYGFTEEELDFIINYDIKYRMGGAAGDDESED